MHTCQINTGTDTPVNIQLAVPPGMSVAELLKSPALQRQLAQISSGGSKSIRITTPVKPATPGQVTPGVMKPIPKMADLTSPASLVTAEPFFTAVSPKTPLIPQPTSPRAVDKAAALMAPFQSSVASLRQAVAASQQLKQPPASTAVAASQQLKQIPTVASPQKAAGPSLIGAGDNQAASNLSVLSIQKVQPSPSNPSLRQASTVQPTGRQVSTVQPAFRQTPMVQRTLQTPIAQCAPQTSAVPVTPPSGSRTTQVRIVSPSVGESSQSQANQLVLYQIEGQLMTSQGIPVAVKNNVISVRANTDPDTIARNLAALRQAKTATP